MSVVQSRELLCLLFQTSQAGLKLLAQLLSEFYVTQSKILQQIILFQIHHRTTDILETRLLVFI